MGALTAIKKLLDKILIFLSITFCGAMVVYVSWQVYTRFVRHDPSAVSEEIADIMFVWMGLSASALLYGEKGHMNITFLPEKVSFRKKQLLTILSEFFTLFMAAWVLAYGGYFITLKGMAQVNAALPWLPIGVIYSIIPITGVCVVFYAIYNIIDAARKFVTPLDGGKA